MQSRTCSISATANCYEPMQGNDNGLVKRYFMGSYQIQKYRGLFWKSLKRGTGTMAKMHGTNFFIQTFPMKSILFLFALYKRLGNSVFLLSRSAEQQCQRNVRQRSRGIQCKLPSAWKMLTCSKSWGIEPKTQKFLLFKCLSFILATVTEEWIT